MKYIGAILLALAAAVLMSCDYHARKKVTKVYVDTVVVYEYTLISEDGENCSVTGVGMEAVVGDSVTCKWREPSE